MKNQRTIGGILESAGYVSPLIPPPLALDERLESMMQIMKAANEQMSSDDELFLDPPELLALARNAGAFPWFLDSEEPTGDKDKRVERRSFFYACDQFKGRTFTFTIMLTLENQQLERRINFDAIGEGHSKRWRFKRV